MAASRRAPQVTSRARKAPATPASSGLLGTVVKALTTEVGMRRDDARSTDGPDREPSERNTTAADLQCMLMSTDLRSLLDRARGSRRVLKHLAMLEIRLRLEGAGVIDTLPWSTLKKVVSQLESVLPYPIPQGVAALRARLDVALLAREREHRQKTAPVPTRPGSLAPSTFLHEQKLVVEEVSLSDFDREVRSWATTLSSHLACDPMPDPIPDPAPEARS